MTRLMQQLHRGVLHESIWLMPNVKITSLYGTHAQANGSCRASAVGYIGTLLGLSLAGLILLLQGRGGVLLFGSTGFVLAAVLNLFGVEARGMMLEGWSE